MSIRLILCTLSVWLVPLERGFLGALRAFRTFPHPGFDSWAKVRSPDCFLSRNLYIEENFEEKFEYSLFFQELDILSPSLHVKPSSWQITKTWRSLSISSFIYDQFVPVCWKTLPPKAGTVNVEVELYKLVKSFQTWQYLLSLGDKPQRAVDLNSKYKSCLVTISIFGYHHSELEIGYALSLMPMLAPFIWNLDKSQLPELIKKINW